MSTFGEELRSLRDLLAEQGIEVTFERLAIILDEAGESEEHDCVQCRSALLGLCYGCLVTRIQEDL